MTDTVRQVGPDTSNSRLAERLVLRAFGRQIEARRRTVEERSRRLEALASMNRTALEGASISGLLQGAADAVAHGLGVELVAVLQRVSAGRFSWRGAVGWSGFELGTTLHDPGLSALAQYTVMVDAPLSLRDATTDVRFMCSSTLNEHGARAVVCVPVASGSEAFGAMLAFSDRPRAFSDDERRFMTEVADAVADGFARRQAERRLLHQALHDPLTGLANRTLLTDRLQQAMAVAERRHRHVALLLLDLDGFKTINDTYGHTVGDRVLRDVADRLRASVRDADTVARYGGDEFAIVLGDVDVPERIVVVAERIRRCLTEPAPLDGLGVTSASIGIALHPDHGTDPDALLERADIAMYGAKRRGGGVCLVYGADTVVGPPSILRQIPAAAPVPDPSATGVPPAPADRYAASTSLWAARASVAPGPVAVPLETSAQNRDPASA